MTGLAIRHEPRLIDIDYGTWAGRAPHELSEDERRQWERWKRAADVALPGAEDPKAVLRRARSALDDCASRHPAACVAVVAHDAVLQLVLADVLRIPLASYRGIAQHTATSNALAHGDDGWTVRLLNSAWHLELPPTR